MPSISASKEAPVALVIAHAQTWASEHPHLPLNLFALVDAGQDKTTWRRFAEISDQAISLLNTRDSASDAFCPHVLALGLASDPSAKVQAALTARHPTTAFTLLCSPFSTTELHNHLARFVEVTLSDNMEMLLAYWDPAILGTLIGMKDDDTLHVRGPVLDSAQLQALLSPIAAWWYCDRECRWHQTEPIPRTNIADVEPGFVLTQAQEDMLVEASVPDQVLYHLELNRPTLFDDDKTHAMRYGFIKIVSGSARQLGLSGMRDLVNFTALCLIYRRRMQTDPEIAYLLDLIGKKSLTLDQALPLMPE